MSDLDVGYSKGLKYGGIPYSELLSKLELTKLDDPIEKEYHDYDPYRDYVRSEVIDWSPDSPFLESDRPSRDPSTSKSILNLRYNGTRGSDPDLPRHPDLFYGFTGNDPRGVDNVPRFDQMREHMNVRAARTEVNMGDNNDQSLAERPWTAQSISYGLKRLQKLVKARAYIFTTEKEGRTWGNDSIVSDDSARRIRSMELNSGGETIHEGSTSTNDTRRSSVIDGQTAPWRNAIKGTFLPSQKYGRIQGTGLHQQSQSLRSREISSSWERSKVNRMVMGAIMAAATKSILKDVNQDQFMGDHIVRSVTGIGLPSDVALIYKEILHDQNLNRSMVGMPANSGVNQHNDMTRISRNISGPLHRGITITNIVKALKNNPADISNIADLVRMDGLRLSSIGHNSVPINSGLLPEYRNVMDSNISIPNSMVIANNPTSILIKSDNAHAQSQSIGTGTTPNQSELTRVIGGVMEGLDQGRIPHMIDRTLIIPAANEGKSIHKYGRVHPSTSPHTGQNESADWGISSQSKIHRGVPTTDEWRSSTKGQAIVGGEFGANDGADSIHGTGRINAKKIRGNEYSTQDWDDENPFTGMDES